MTRARLPLPPSIAELAELSRRLASKAPDVLPALVWCICRSSRTVRELRSWRPSSAHLAMLQTYPAGKQLIASSRDGAEWLRKWAEMSSVLDELLPAVTYLPPSSILSSDGKELVVLKSLPDANAAPTRDQLRTLALIESYRDQIFEHVDALRRLHAVFDEGVRYLRAVCGLPGRSEAAFIDDDV